LSILVDASTRVLVQGITGAQARRDVAHCRAYGTRVVCGVTPGRGGMQVDGLPVYNTVGAALAIHEIDATLIYAPPYAVRDAVLESLAAGIRLAVVLAENVPVHDALVMRASAERAGALVVGCNTNGLLSPGQCKLGGIGGDLPARVFMPGRVGIVSRSGGMSAELALTLKAAGYGVSTAVSMGGDAVPCTPMVRYLALFDADPGTEATLLFGEPGTPNEQEAADWLAARSSAKPVIAVLAGEFQERYPAGASFGHAAAMIQDPRDTVSAKRRMLADVGAHVVRRLGELGPLLDRLGVTRIGVTGAVEDAT